jgi:hypothetical protein
MNLFNWMELAVLVVFSLGTIIAWLLVRGGK